jgi:hypothetical protein
MAIVIDGHMTEDFMNFLLVDYSACLRAPVVTILFASRGHDPSAARERYLSRLGYQDAHGRM